MSPFHSARGREEKTRRVSGSQGQTSFGEDVLSAGDNLSLTQESARGVIRTARGHHQEKGIEKTRAGSARKSGCEEMEAGGKRRSRIVLGKGK